jgi:hypothetical protein
MNPGLLVLYGIQLKNKGSHQKFMEHPIPVLGATQINRVSMTAYLFPFCFLFHEKKGARLKNKYLAHTKSNSRKVN